MAGLNLQKLLKNKIFLAAIAVIAVVYFFGDQINLNLNLNRTEGFTSEEEEASVGKKVLVLFYAPWCPHCKDVMPTWDKLQKNHAADKGVDVKKVDCEKNPEKAKDNGVQAFPTIVLFKDGKKIAVFDDERTETSIENFVNSY